VATAQSKFEADLISDFMKQKYFARVVLLRLAAIVVCLASQAVMADEVGDVSQLVQAGKWSEALSKADHYLAGHPKDAQMRLIKGVIQRENGKISDAIATFTRLSEEFPSCPNPSTTLP